MQDSAPDADAIARDDAANVFALYLLMPETFWAQDMARGLDLSGDETTSELARRYRVPISTIGVRYALWKEHGR